jgi:hypothetical protein
MTFITLWISVTPLHTLSYAQILQTFSEMIMGYKEGVKFSPCLIKEHTIKTHGEIEISQ